MSKRLKRVYLAAATALAAITLIGCSTASAVRPSADYSLSPEDRIFIQLREAARNNDAGRAVQLAAQIPNYPAPVISITSPSSRNFSTRKAMRVSMHPMNRSSHSCSATTARLSPTGCATTI